MTKSGDDKLWYPNFRLCGSLRSDIWFTPISAGDCSPYNSTCICN